MGREPREPSTHVRALAAEVDSATILVTTTDRTVASATTHLWVAQHHLEVEPADWKRLAEGEVTVWLTKQRVTGLTPGTDHLITVRSGGDDHADGSVATLPGPDGSDVTVVFGSCFDIDATAADQTGDAYNLAVLPSRRDRVPVYNVWCGDQVYVDAPWQEGWRISDARRVILETYVDTWGHGQRASGFAYAMSQAGNWYLPDDHEFWNGYPHPSFVTLPWHTIKRLGRQLLRFWTPRYAEPHPSAQGEWGAAAGEMYCHFQTDRTFTVFDDDVNPRQVQTVDLGAAVLVLADTRWHRTIRKATPGARFIRDDDLAQVEHTLRSESRLVCLSLSRPIVGRLPQSGPLRGRVEFAPEDYPRQYIRLWQALQRRADAGLPTLVFGGDVHHHSIRTAFDDAMLEVVSSPLALLESLTEGSLATKASKAWLTLKQGARRIWDVVTASESAEASALAHPRFADLDRPAWQTAEGRSVFEADEFQSGVTSVRVSATTAGTAVTIRSVRTSGGLEQPENTCDFHYRWDGARWVTEP